MSNWIGYAVSVNCGEPLGCYQGTILQADGTTITLTKAFRNGFPYPKPQVTLNAADIKELKIIETRSEPAEQTHSTVAVTKSNKKGHRATVCENLQANPSSSGNQPAVSTSGVNTNKSGNNRVQGQGPARSKPIDIQGPRTNKNNTHAGSYGGAGSTPKGRAAAGGGDKARRRNEACFGDLAEPALHDDFDFEGNLALFDKRALWEQMNAQANKPDLVRQADEAGKLRHDQNVLAAAAPPARRAVRVPPALAGGADYVTDGGLVVGSVSARARRRLWDAVWRAGGAPAALTLEARAAADVALRLVGGGRRLDPRNAHQTPVVVALLGAHGAAAAGAAAARLLAAHGARAALHVAAPAAALAAAPPDLRRELAAARLAGAALEPELRRLPAPDLVLLALHDPRGEEAAGGAGAGGAEEAAVSWARAARAACVSLEPPERGWAGAGAASRAAVVALLPAALSPSLGRVFLANVAPPLSLFSELGIEYRPPFGAASVLPLHAADDGDLLCD
ncbi:enhancer of mRNA-decapping protein 3 [Achroia grisella]|uniref:enhancer of mRNA-decapping protein 3 n=1 Tax=Achroia grisella TaxID=688607 RepID=UPI0027D31679|nr:enhancer of mRNA-decapping protein 3 [Achroia grisella]